MPGDVEDFVDLFEQYRSFYGKAPTPDARTFLAERIDLATFERRQREGVTRRFTDLVDLCEHLGDLGLHVGQLPDPIGGGECIGDGVELPGLVVEVHAAELG